MDEYNQSYKTRHDNYYDEEEQYQSVLFLNCAKRIKRLAARLCWLIIIPIAIAVYFGVKDLWYVMYDNRLLLLIAAGVVLYIGVEIAFGITCKMYAIGELVDTNRRILKTNKEILRRLTLQNNKPAAKPDKPTAAPERNDTLPEL